MINNTVNAKFEKISKYANDDGVIIPTRKTKDAAGYDFYAAENTVIPSYEGQITEWENRMMMQDSHKRYKTYQEFEDEMSPMTLEKMAELTKQYDVRPTLVPTGIKCKLPEGYWLQLGARSSTPLKHWLVLGNAIGIIDADYYNNVDNEGHIYFQMINLSPFDILIKKGDCFGQGMIMPYNVCADETPVETIREGGFGSTNA